MPAISVIIPALNEAGQIAAVISCARRAPEIEVIVADGGSTDDTIKAASEAGAQVVVEAGGRGAQLNVGAARAGAPVLLFLHADTMLPEGYATLVSQTLADERVALGAFSLAIAGASPGQQIVARLANWRSRWLGLPYGDQALFLRAEVFRQLGGFRAWPILEDLDLVRRARKLGRIAIVPKPVTTSSRRWRQLGTLRTTLINQMMLAGYALGFSPQSLALFYRRLRGR